MATRNLTKKFIDIRNNAKANRTMRGSSFSYEENDGGLLKSTSADSSTWRPGKDASLPPAWVEKFEAVDEDVQKIQNKMKELSALHAKRMMVNFNVDETELQQEIEIENKTQEITQIFHHAEGILKKFNAATLDVNVSAAERAVRSNMQRSNAKKLQSLSMSFRASQKEYMTRLKAQKNEGTNAAFDFLDSKKPNAVMEMDMDSGFTQSQLREADNLNKLVDERDEEIVKIAKSIEELAAIFKELAVLVIDQGTILDRIDYNMESAVEHAKEGVKQLEKAETHQKNAMSLRCIIALVVLIAVMIGILIWKHSPSKN